MANTLDNFLIGIGFDFDKKGASEVESSIDSVKSKALQLGAVLAGAFGIKSLTVDFANATNQISRFSDVFGVVPDDVGALGRALTNEGGSIAGLMSQVEGLERLRAARLRGDVGIFADAGKAGIDANAVMNAKNATEAYIGLADQFKNLTKEQRINAAQALGLDESSIRLLSKGSEEVRRLAKEQKTMRPITEGMTKAALEFDIATNDLSTNIGGFADSISETLLPEITKAVTGMNDWIKVNRSFLNQNLDSALEPIAKHFDTIAIAGGLMATGGIAKVFGGLAQSIPIIGGALGVAAAAVARMSPILLGLYAAYELWNPDDFEKKTGIKLFDFFKDPSYQMHIGANGLTFGDPDAGDPMGNYGGGATHSTTFLGRTDNDRTTQAGKRQLGVQSVKIQNEIKLHIDGKAIDSRIEEVTGKQNRQAIDDLKSSTGG